MAEEIIEPQLRIIDAHHHLWLWSQAALSSLEKLHSLSAEALRPTIRRHTRYLLDEYLSDLDTGHNICASVFVDARVMYKATGPEAMKSVGEVEFVSGVAAMGASGKFGNISVCAGIVGGGIDLTLGDAVGDILDAHITAGGGRYRGLRVPVSYDSDPAIFGAGTGRPQVLLEDKFRAGFRHLQPLGLSFDAFVLEPQLPDLLDLARAFPETQIVLNHLGVPVGVGHYSGQRDQRFPLWRQNMRLLAACPNVTVKLGGIGMHFAGFDYASSPVTSVRLASDWRPYIETCIDAFGVSRCMFESNFPVDSATCSYPMLWNAFKRLTSGASAQEKQALFSATAQRVYRLDL
jgi:L-fuconolactonase